MAQNNIVNVIFRASLNELINGAKEGAKAILNVGGEATKAAAQFISGFNSAENKTKALNNAINQSVSEIKEVGTQSNIAGQELGNSFNRGNSGIRSFISSLIEAVRRNAELRNESRQTGNSLHEYFNRGGMGANYATGQVNQLKYAIGALLTAYAGKKLLDFTIGAAFNREQVLMQYEVLLKDAQKARNRLAEITNFADVTPYEMPELIQMDKILTTYKIRTMDWVRTIGDVSGALQNPKEALTEISSYLGRIASGQTGEALQRFEELGIVTRARLKEMGLAFNKQNAYVGSTKDLMDAIYQEFNTTYGGMMDKLSQTGAGLGSTLMDAFKAFGRDIGMGALEQAKGSIKDLIDLFARLREDGTLESLSRNFGDILSKIIKYFRDLIENADEAAQRLNEFASRTNMNFGDLIKTLEMVLELWLSFKIALAIAPLVSALFYGIGLLTGAIKGAAAAQWLLNIAMDANPIGIIVTLIGLLIFGLIRLYRESETARKVMVTAWDAIKIAFLLYTETFLINLWLIIKGIQLLIGWIPGIGTALQKAATGIENALQSVDKQIKITKSNMQDLWNTANNGIKGTYSAVNATLDAGEEAALKANREMRKQSKSSTETNTPTVPTNTPSPSVGSAKDTRTYAEKQTEAIDKKYNTKIDLAESKISLAEAQNNTGAKKTAAQTLISTLTQKAADLLKAATGAKTTTDRNVLETARNKIVEQILKVTENINNGIGQMVGAFNAPSEIAAMTNYQYTVLNQQGNTITKTQSVEPKVDVHLTIPNTGTDGQEKLKSDGKNLGKAFMVGLKDGLVEEFSKDAGRN